MRSRSRARVGGKFIFVGDEKRYLRGVTYGPFAPRDGVEFPPPDIVERDLARMASAGANALRTYTVPPQWLLDLASAHELLVMVGLPWEQHVAFLDERGCADSIERRVRGGVAACAGHPAVLCYVIGNEIPAAIVRWHGRGQIEQFLERLHRAARAEDPDALVTYVNYPSTEYLQLPFVDVVCFNVYLEAEEQLEAYVAHLQTIAGDRPLLITELGLDSRRNGEEAQAIVVGWQVRTAFAAGCAGAFVFSWTDAWHRGGLDVDDWAFGLTDRAGRPKPALHSVSSAFAEVPFREDLDWPFVSVIVCSHNGAATLRECLDGVARVEYPRFEAIVVDDGSTDATVEIAESFGVQIVSIAHSGLSSARNAGLRAARGEIVAYLDDDCRPDPHWLTYLATTFLATPHVGVGGPNVPPPTNETIAECVAQAPGGPVHVLISDREAEHIPGCNMAFRRDALEAVGAFDPQFRIAGDDVDVCWRLRSEGWTLGFNPGAMIWHRPRDSVRAYLRQQREYGKAEALLERKWPERYNRTGHLDWAGHVYGNGVHVRPRRWRIYYGTWGSGLFQSVYQRSPSTLSALPLMPEWYLLLAFLAALSAYELTFGPFAGIAVGPPLFVVCAAALLAQTFRATRACHLSGLKKRSLVTLLHLLQPAARLWGRLRHGLTPWRQRGAFRLALPRSRTCSVWSEDWQPATKRLAFLEARLRDHGAAVLRGGSFDRWDIQVRTGPLGSARVRMATEEHGHGRQLARFRLWPKWSRGGLLVLLFLGGLAAYAISIRNADAAVISGIAAAVLALRMVQECAAALGLFRRGLADTQAAPDDLAHALAGRVMAVSRPPNRTSVLESRPLALSRRVEGDEE